ncbi:MAG: hypothetical protein HEQ34_02170 [Sphingorhabdus sp.]|uniref:hypothetical protein n=1 Tax=Sphingorhabdus sp. TaxID=1902408 RepID=UPI0025F65AE5|nr:hypothetical protein [Sphingorhabdus sp.]MCO4090743.1 hypothetical protein [Sphingorhabdus sp.]
MKVTETDVTIAAAFYPILVECARQSPVKKLTYGALLDEAKVRFPNNDAVQSAIPISLGRRLDVVRIFLAEQKLPNLTSLIVNAGTGEVGVAFGSDAERIRAEVAAFDWSTVSDEFNLHISSLRKNIKPRSRPKISSEAARNLMSEYYLGNRASIPKGLESKRNKIIEMIREGLSPEEAFAKAVP